MEQGYYIKANLPATEDAYRAGTGEGCYFIVDAATKAAHDSDTEGGGYSGILDNDSAYYPGLMHGERLPLEMRGLYRPVVPFSALEPWRGK